MSHMTRRALLAGVSLSVLLAVVPAAGAANGKPGAISIREDGKICEREARERFQAIIQKMMSAAEKRAGHRLSGAERETWLSGGWDAAIRGVIKQHYAFFD